VAALRVIAGRGAARVCIQLSVVALLPVWGIEEFGLYVAATGTFGWLVVLVMGVEKAGLTILPRTRMLTQQYIRMLLGRAATPLLLAALIAGPLAVAGGTPALFGAAAIWTAGQGLLSVLASIHRLAGRPGRDSAAYLALAGWVIAMSGLAFVGVLRPYGYLLMLIAGVLVDCAVLAVLIPALRSRPVRPRRGRRLGLLIGRRVLLLGMSDVADSASVAALYVVMAAVGRSSDSATVYLLLLVSSWLSALVNLVLRLGQPATSLRLRGLGGELGRGRAGRLTGWATSITSATVALTLGAALLVYSVSGVDGVARIGTSPVVLGAVAIVEMTVYCVVAYAVFLLENTNGAALSVTSSSSVTGFVATAIAAAAAIPVLHAVGAVLAVIVGIAAKAGLLHLRVRRGGRWRPVLPVPERAMSG
jgi:hypothetical protein